nr:hypothetical protein [uncultured Campylobacter sp.]
MLFLPARKLCLKITAVKLAKLFAKSSAPAVLFCYATCWAAFWLAFSSQLTQNSAPNTTTPKSLPQIAGAFCVYII